MRIPLNYVPSGAGKNNGGNAGAVKGSPALKSFWIGHPRRKKEPGKETGNPVEKAKEKGVQDGKR